MVVNTGRLAMTDLEENKPSSRPPLTRLGPEVIDGHFTYEFALRQADVQVGESTERVRVDLRNDALSPCAYGFLESRRCLT
jgi:hypothetical protein